MSNPLGHQDVTGNFVTCGDLFNISTKSSPVAAAGSGLAAAGAYVPGQVAFSSAATSNTFQAPYAETLVVLVQLTSGAGSFALNTGATATALTQTAFVAASSTSMVAMLVAMPSAALGTSLPGAPTAPFFNVSVVTSGCQIGQIAVFPLGFVPIGADWINFRSSINAVGSGVTNTNDVPQPPTNLIGSGAFTILSTQA